MQFQTFDVCSRPFSEVKPKNPQDSKSTSKWESSQMPPLQKKMPKYRIIVQCHQDVQKTTVDKFASVPSLKSALETSIREDYPDFTPLLLEDPHERMPLLKDPVLVRAAQLAVLEVSKDPRSKEDELFVVRMLKSIERKFQNKLKERLNFTKSHHEQ